MDANEAIAPLHYRMPVILPEANWPVSLGEMPAQAEELRAMLVPLPRDQMDIWPMDRRVAL